MTILCSSSSSSSSNLEESNTLGSLSTPRWLSRWTKATSKVPLWWNRSYSAGGGVDDLARSTLATSCYKHLFGGRCARSTKILWLYIETCPRKSRLLRMHLNYWAFSLSGVSIYSLTNSEHTEQRTFHWLLIFLNSYSLKYESAKWKCSQDVFRIQNA